MTAAMPTQGTAWPILRDEMVRRGANDARWRDGKTAVYVFNAGPEVAEVQREAYAMYMSENGLGPLAFPSLATMESEVIAMGLELLHGDSGCVGNMTSGGTDSITMAIKAARDHAIATRPEPFTPNIVVPRSAHPAFDKACHLMGIELRRVPISSGLVADPSMVEAALDDDTILFAGSAPSFPYGLMDPLEELSALAERRGIWLHVDACVGGYIAPFVRMNGEPIAPFDFELGGVMSMSADLHKYGYCAKGASTVLFRNDELRGHMQFDFADWPGGRMVTPTLAGTRPGGAIAAAWAVMNHLGVDGYRERHGLVTDARGSIETGVEALGFEVLGEPQLGIVAFTRDGLDIASVYRQMYRRGWFAALTTEPMALHLMLSPVHAAITDEYLRDLAESVEAVMADDQSSEPFEARYS